jgi:hypothetical protein
MQWKTTLNAACIVTRIRTASIRNYLVQNGVGDFTSNNSPSWTGGWVNRFQFKDFSAGIDFLYHFNETTVDSTSPASKTNSLLLQYIYAGYYIHSSKAKTIEIFLDSRNLFHNSKSDLTDGRRYYGIGGKIGL